MDNWSILEEIIADWWSPLEKQDGIKLKYIAKAEKRLGIKLPTVMTKWYSTAGRMGELIGPDIIMSRLSQLQLRSSVLEFCVECEGVVKWGIRGHDLNYDDPPVLVTEYVYGTTPQLNSFSEFIVSLFITKIISDKSWKFKAFGKAKQDTIETLENLGNFIEIQDPIPINKTRLFYSKGAVAKTNSTKNLWLTCNNQDTFERIANLIDVEWESYPEI